MRLITATLLFCVVAFAQGDPNSYCDGGNQVLGTLFTCYKARSNGNRGNRGIAVQIERGWNSYERAKDERGQLIFCARVLVFSCLFNIPFFVCDVGDANLGSVTLDGETHML